MKAVLQIVGRLAWVAPRRYVYGSLMWAVVTILPLASGLVLQQIFDQLSRHRIVDLRQPLWLCAAFVGVEAMRGLMIVISWTYGDYWWSAAVTVLRLNIMRSILTARGAAASRLPHTAGEAVGRFRDDASDLVQLTDNSVPLFGATLFGIGAVVVMVQINPVITLVLVLPMIAIGVLSRLLGGLIGQLHSQARVLGSTVTAYVGEIFGGVLTIKTAGAQEAVLQRLREHNKRRRNVAVRDQLATNMLDTATGATVEISIGLVLLLAAPAMRRGEFTVGDLALFTSYASWLTMLPTVVGEVLYRLPQAEVALDRLGRLLPAGGSANIDELSRNTGLWLRGDPPALRTSLPDRADPLETLEARGLTVRYDGNGRGVRGVDLRLRRGSITVITGAVGSGKTTLVRALLGLVPAEGTVSWNGVRVQDPGTFLVPNRAAYAGQVPRIFSESLGENLLLGWPTDRDDVQRAVELAVLEQDLAQLPAGLDTRVGPCGVRLSGGQVQRATAARALVRSPDLLVVDDLSSALDVQTENVLWDRIANATSDGRGPRAVLVVSHRRAALERADQIIVLDRGRVADRGPLTELLATCPEMRRLWSEELIIEAQERPAGAAPGRNAATT
jgi:ATP-binding cassette subfamily B protein